MIANTGVHRQAWITYQKCVQSKSMIVTKNDNKCFIQS